MHLSFLEQENLIALLPAPHSPATLIVGNTLPCNQIKIDSSPTAQFINGLNRQIWAEGLYAREADLEKIKRYKNQDGSYKNDFDATQFLQWVNTIEDNVAICDMENTDMGKGVFVPFGKKLSQGTFIPSSGIIKLDPTNKELATKVHCSALQDLNTPTKKIYGFIDPAQIGGILDLINHAPDRDEMLNFDFQSITIKESVAVSNLKSTIKFYNGYAIMGLEVFEDINGGEYGRQLLWSYARSCEYLEENTLTPGKSTLLLFDNRDKHNGKIIDSRHYSLRKIDIFINRGKLMLQKIASLTRWELMEDAPDSGDLISMGFNLANQSEDKQFLVEKKFLQQYLKNNDVANRIILDISVD